METNGWEWIWTQRALMKFTLPKTSIVGISLSRGLFPGAMLVSVSVCCFCSSHGIFMEWPKGNTNKFSTNFKGEKDMQKKKCGRKVVDHIIFFPLCYLLLLAIYYPFPSFLYYPFRKVLLCIQYPCKQQRVFLFRYPKDLFRPLSITLQFLVSTAMIFFGKDTVEHENHWKESKQKNRLKITVLYSLSEWCQVFVWVFFPFCLFSSARRFISLMCFFGC